MRHTCPLDRRYVYFAAAWCFAKLLCLDPLTFLLALSSGVLFGGVLQGALISTTCATLGSTLAFLVSRNFARERFERVIAKVPTLRALDRAVASEAFKTVLVLRLSPLLPIPIGAYNYIYGATTMTAIDFAPAMFVGSLKPYLLDSYLGIATGRICPLLVVVKTPTPYATHHLYLQVPGRLRQVGHRARGR